MTAQQSEPGLLVGEAVPVAARPAASPSAPPRGMRWWRRPGNLQLVVGVVLVAPIVIMAVAAPLIAHSDPEAADLLAKLTPPFWQDGGSTKHLLGTDQLGRDLFSRVVYGARVSLIVGCLAAIGSGIIGVVIGLFAGYFRGPFDTVVTGIADIQQSFPFLALAIVLGAVIGRGTGKLALILIIAGWILVARVVRGETAAIAQRQFIESARALGAGHLRIMFRYILPNIRSSIIIITTFNFAWFIIAEASLSFLGLGVDPSIPSWGQMLSDSRNYLVLAWWFPTFPGLALVALVLGVNLLGDGLQDRWDPYLR